MIRKIIALILMLLFVISCTTSPHPPSEWMGVPIHPKATDFRIIEADILSSYVVKVDESEIETFYKEKMVSTGWVYLETGYISLFDSRIMWFAKDKNTVSITLDIEDNSTVVGISLGDTVANTREGFPVFPSAIESKDEIVSYHYTVDNADIDAVQRFYKKQMQANGWELLGVGDVSGTDIGKAYALWFVKGQNIASVDIFANAGVIHIMIHMDVKT